MSSSSSAPESPPTTAGCRICGNRAGNSTFAAREMLLGTREVFQYFECAQCGCVQIATIPTDLGRHYPQSYFAFRDYRKLATAKARRFIDARRLDHALGRPNWLGLVGNRLSKPLSYAAWVREAGIDTDARVLDIGCGAGKLLLQMKLGGFEHCTGVDPFLPEDLDYPNRVTIHGTSLDRFSAGREGQFDFIMLHHSLEHMPNQAEALASVRALLAPNGTALVRIPIAGSWAWREYQAHWANLDPPRHLYLHTEASLARCAERAGLQVAKTIFDSTEFQFMGSEIYRRDIAGNEHPPERKPLEAKRDYYRAEAERLNAQGCGDMAAFYLRAQ